jgi:hypothetical protein
MTIQEITTDLEISKELEENGFPQDGLFWWIKFAEGYKVKDEAKVDTYCRYYDTDDTTFYSAPTAEELLKELPKNVKWKTLFINNQDLYFLFYADIGRNDENRNVTLYKEKEIQSDKKLCNALAKMWLYLKKNNLLEETKSTKDGE